MTFFCKRFDDLSPSEVYEILKARCEVFLLEQRIICQDMDDVDYDALHFFIKEGNKEFFKTEAHKHMLCRAG